MCFWWSHMQMCRLHAELRPASSLVQRNGRVSNSHVDLFNRRQSRNVSNQQFHEVGRFSVVPNEKHANQPQRPMSAGGEGSAWKVSFRCKTNVGQKSSSSYSSSSNNAWKVRYHQQTWLVWLFISVQVNSALKHNPILPPSEYHRRRKCVFQILL